MIIPFPTEWKVIQDSMVPNHQPVNLFALVLFFHPPETWPVPFDPFVSDEPLRIQPLIHHVHCIEPMEIPVWYVSGKWVKKKWLQKWKKEMENLVNHGQ
jgi:hypothetical protein